MESGLVLNRINNLIKADKKENPEKLARLIKSEIVYLLKNYMEINMDDVKLDFGIDNDGRYLLNVICSAKRLIIAQSVL